MFREFTYTNNESEDFVLGGMVRAQDSQIYEIDNHLKNMEIFPIGVFRLDYMNYNILDYEITCELCMKMESLHLLIQ